MSDFRPDRNESERHRRAKEALAGYCRELGMDVETEMPVETQLKTYYCDVYATFSYFGSPISLDLEVEDFDHSKHDFDDAENKARELDRYFIRTIWLKSRDILLSKSKSNPKSKPSPSAAPVLERLAAKILFEMQDGHVTDPRMNI